MQCRYYISSFYESFRSSVKITLLFLFVLFCSVDYAQAGSGEFASAQDAIIWAKANKTAAADITHITITGNNDDLDLLKLRSLNNNSGSGLFKALESIELSAQTGTIPNSCFYAYYTGAQWLKKFSAPNLTGIGSWAFRFCTGLSSVELPAVINIGAYAFYNCSLTSIDLPASLANIDANPFLGCKNLKTITVDAGNEYFTMEAGVLYNAGKTLLITYPLGKAGTSFTSPNTVTSIGSNAFGICTGLSAVELPAVTSIRDWASEYCTGFKTVRFGASGTMNFGTNVFSGVTTTNIDLYLDETGEEYVNNVNGNTWKGYDWKSVNKAPTKIPDVEKPSLRLYPNPVQDILYIESNETVSGIAVYDLNAKIVLQTTYTSSGINLSTLPTALYVVKITSASGVSMVRVVKGN